ncbi:hypothetical protein J4L45_004583 [Salmonella enterica subsp. enterica serovar Newport]|nr:hypothetical protein [Salmonella enterica subsp. enterica serovar Newport]EHB3482351.1 hypothetical protein [Salmonella enterica subsp. enterica serovar Newport]EHG5859514.1 hypothetical protein [Salmonella enterica subsp. enterica serovar Newport]
MKILIKNMMFIFPFLLLGCDKDESLNPSPDGEMVSVIAKMPPDSKILPLEIMYRSTICLKNRKNSNGNVVKEPGYHFVKKEFNPASGGSTFNLKVALDGGGQCHWRLSNVTLGFNLKELPPDKDEKSENIPIKEIVVFDDNSPQRISGSYEYVNGNVTLKGDYFPLITKRRGIGSPVEYSIVRSSPDVIYKSTSAKEVIFEPRLHFSKALRATEPAEQKVGVYMSVLYPDGTVESKPYFPNYKKLQLLSKGSD